MKCYKRCFWKVLDILFVVGMLWLIPFYVVAAGAVYLFLSFFIYWIFSKYEKGRVTDWYKYSVQDDNVYLHFAPTTLFYWMDSKKMMVERKKAIALLKQMGYSSIRGKTISLQSINVLDSKGFRQYLPKWNKEGVYTLATTIFATVCNLRNICTLSVARKLYKMIFVHSYTEWEYLPS